MSIVLSALSGASASASASASTGVARPASNPATAADAAPDAATPAANATTTAAAPTQPSATTTMPTPTGETPPTMPAESRFFDVLRGAAQGGQAADGDTQATADDAPHAHRTGDRPTSVDQPASGDASVDPTLAAMQAPPLPLMPGYVPPTVAPATAPAPAPATPIAAATAAAAGGAAAVAQPTIMPFAPVRADARPSTTDTAARSPDADAPTAALPADGARPSSAVVRMPIDSKSAPVVSAPDRAPVRSLPEAPAPAKAAAPPAAAASSASASATLSALMSAPAFGQSADASIDTTVKLPAGTPAAWKPALVDALGDRLQLQLGRGIDQAVIRLDPPSLGRIDISIRHEAGNLQVVLSASNGDVLRQLHAVSETMRQDLVQRQYGDVAVVVSGSPRDGTGAAGQGGGQAGQGGNGREREAQTPGRALAEAETDTAPSVFTLARDRG